MTPVVEFREVPGGRWPDMTLYCILPPSGSWNLVTITKNIFEEMFLHFLTFSLSRNWYNGYIDNTKICGTLSNLTKICLIKLNKTKTYNYLYLTKLYIDICILSCFFFYHSFDGHGYFRPGSERSQRSVDRLFRPYWWQTFHFLPKYYI